MRLKRSEPPLKETETDPGPIGKTQPLLAPRSLSDALSDRAQQKAQEIGSKSARVSNNVRFCPCDVFARQHCTSNVTQNGTRMILCCAFFTSSCCITNVSAWLTSEIRGLSRNYYFMLSNERSCCREFLVRPGVLESDGGLERSSESRKHQKAL